MRRGRPRCCALAIAAVVTLLGTTAYAEWPYDDIRRSAYGRAHFYLGGGPAVVLVLNQTGPRRLISSGGGFHLTLGGRLGRHFGLEFNWSPSFHYHDPDYFGRIFGLLRLTTLSFDGKFYPVSGPIQPFLIFGGGAYMLGDRFSLIAGGPGYQLGGGIDFWLTRHISVGVTVQYRGALLFDDFFARGIYLSLFTGSLELTGRF
jgi:opacity protein-like surface antigen